MIKFIFTPSLALIRNCSASLKSSLVLLFNTWFLPLLVALISVCLILFKKWPIMGIMVATVSSLPKMDCRSFAPAVFLLKNDFNCVLHAMNLCLGSLIFNSLEFTSHPNTILTSSGAPSASFLSSAMKLLAWYFGWFLILLRYCMHYCAWSRF